MYSHDIDIANPSTWYQNSKSVQTTSRVKTANVTNSGHQIVSNGGSALTRTTAFRRSKVTNRSQPGLPAFLGVSSAVDDISPLCCWESAACLLACSCRCWILTPWDIVIHNLTSSSSSFLLYQHLLQCRLSDLPFHSKQRTKQILPAIGNDDLGTTQFATTTSRSLSLLHFFVHSSLSLLAEHPSTCIVSFSPFLLVETRTQFSQSTLSRPQLCRNVLFISSPSSLSPSSS